MESSQNINVFIKLFALWGKTPADFEVANDLAPGYVNELITNNKDLPPALVLQFLEKYSEPLTVLDIICIDVEGDKSNIQLVDYDFNPHEEDTDEWTDVEIDKYLEKKSNIATELP